jgi:hypothetical protein
MAIESLDQVNKKDWLICVRGPKIVISNNPFDDSQTMVIDHSIEGCLVQVLAINPPIMLVRLYPNPGTIKPKRIAVNWEVAKWSKANKGYVRAYLKKNPKSTKGENRSIIVIDGTKSFPPKESK